MSLNISQVEITSLKAKDGLLAFASCLIDEKLYLDGISIHTSLSTPDGLRLVYPAKTLPNGKQVFYFHPISREAGTLIHKAVVQKYKNVIEKVTRNDDSTTSIL